MKRILPAALAALALTAAAAAPANPLGSGEVFYTGCNYWASNAGMYMWRRWNPTAVKVSGTVTRIWNGELKDGVLKLAANDAAVFVLH